MVRLNLHRLLAVPLDGDERTGALLVQVRSDPGATPREQTRPVFDGSLSSHTYEGWPQIP